MSESIVKTIALPFMVLSPHYQSTVIFFFFTLPLQKELYDCLGDNINIQANLDTQGPQTAGVSSKNIDIKSSVWFTH